MSAITNDVDDHDDVYIVERMKKMDDFLTVDLVEEVYFFSTVMKID